MDLRTMRYEINVHQVDRIVVAVTLQGNEKQCRAVDSLLICKFWIQQHKIGLLRRLKLRTSGCSESMQHDT